MSTNINKLTIGNSTLKRYADLDYDEWYAIAEFLDNSLHSFIANKKELSKVGVEICDIRLSLSNSGNGEEINILDNAGGIHPDDFPRLLSLGEPKEKSETQLSEFGMGMKTAAIWLGNIIEIETKHYLENKCFQIVIDINKLGTENEVSIKEVKPSSNLRCYTKVKVKELNRNISRKKTKIKNSLSSIYRKFIQNNIVKITFEDEELSPFDIKLRKDKEGEPLKKEFEIILSNGKKSKGWLGIMEKGKTVISGFSVYRHNRLIQGYPENSWRPAEVFGQEGGSNTTKNQRLIGELDMTDFNVAHTKNKINFVDDEENEFRKKLGEYCSDIAREADKVLKVKNTKEHESKPSVQIAKEKVTEFFKKPVNTDVKSIEFIAPSIKSKTPSKIKEIFETEEPHMDLSHMKNVEGIEKAVKVYHFMDSNLPYMIMDEIDETLVVCINVSHPYYSNISMNGTAEKEMEFKINCLFDALAELII